MPDEQDGLRLSTYPSNMVSRLLVDFYKTWGPRIHIEHHEGTVEEITNHVHQGISEVGIVYVAQKQTPTFQHILFHKKLEFVPQSEKSICVYVGPQHPLYHAESVDFSELPNLKFMRGVRDFFSMEHHLETVSMGVIDQSVMKHVIYSDSDHSIINFLLHTDVCSLGLNFMHRPMNNMISNRCPSTDASRFSKSAMCWTRAPALAAGLLADRAVQGNAVRA